MAQQTVTPMIDLAAPTPTALSTPGSRAKADRAADQHARPSFPYSPALAREMEPLYEKVKSVITPMEWRHYAPLIREINLLKKQRNAVILAHNYMTPEIFHGVSDFRGDSLQLAKAAAVTKADVIVQAGVHFMAETSKLLSPDKMVLIPDMRAGCSLAASITAEDVRMLRAAYPGVPIVTYVNTSAAGEG
jgi:quinolinate synthase